MKEVKFFVLVLILSLSFAGCAADLVVSDLTVNWDNTNKKAVAEIANIGNWDAGEFLVYFNGDECPVSQNYRPQVSHSVPELAKGTSIILNSDFAPLAHPENNNLGNVYKITVLVDPKNMVKESSENNNEKSASVFKAESEFVFHVLTGNAGVSGYGSQGPAGDNLIFSIDLETGWTLFEDYTHVTFIASPNLPSSLEGTTIRLINGMGRYNFTTGNFSCLQFDVRVEDANGNVTIATHGFSGQTTAPLSVPVGSSPPFGIGLQLSLSQPFSIDLGGGLSGNVSIATAEFVSAADLP